MLKGNRKGTVFLLLSLAIAVADSVFVYANYHFTRAAFHAELGQQRDTYARALRAQIDNTTRNLVLFASLFANNPRVQDLFLEGRRAVEAEGGGPGAERAAAARRALYAQVAPQWNEAIRNFKARQLHFHLGPGSLSFLRVHQPNKFGDRMDETRHIIVDTNADHQEHTGFETGRIYSGLRGVVPVWATPPGGGERTYVGALEAGTSFAEPLATIDSHFGVGIAVLLSEEHIQSAVWPEFVEEKYGKEIEGCRCYLEESSREEVREVIRTAIDQTGPLKSGDSVRLVELGDKTLALSLVPVRDYLGSRHPERPDAGKAVFWRDISETMAAYRQEQRFNLFYALLAYLLVEVLMYLAFRGVTRHLQRQVEQATHRLREAQQVAEMGNWVLDHRTGELSWSDEVYRIFELHPDRFVASYAGFLKLVHPEDRREVDETFKAAVENRGPYEIEHRLLLKDASVKHVLEKGITHFDAKGRPTESIGTVYDITRRVLAERARVEAEKRWVMALDGAGHGVWDWDALTGKVFYSLRWKEMLGYADAEIGDSRAEWQDRVHPDDLPAALAALEQHLAGTTPIYQSEHRLRCKDGSYLWVRDQGMVFDWLAEGQPRRVVGTHTDITDRKRAEVALEESHRHISALLENTAEAYIAIDGRHRVNYFNQSAENLWGIGRDTVIGRELWEAIPEMVSHFYKPVLFAMKTRQLQRNEGYFPPLHKYLDVRLYPWEEGLWAFFQDITERKLSEAEMERLASTDALTGAYNRMRFTLLIEAEVERSRRYGENFALIMFDIDHFKQVNDRHGHARGDQVLCEVVKRIERTLRKPDSLGRWGGEEFMILMPETQMEGAGIMARRCLEAISAEPFSEVGTLTISLGVADYRSESRIDALLELVDQRLYQAKAAGRNRVSMGP